MPRFSFKEILLGLTLTCVGLGMLAAAFHASPEPATREIGLLRAFQIAFGGAFVGCGLSFPIRYPPYRMIFSMIGMFAAQAWQTGSGIGLFVYIGLMAIFGCRRAFQAFRAKRKAGDESVATGVISE